MSTARMVIPYQNICDVIFKSELRPAVYRWISGLSPEELARFRSVFTRIANDIKTKAGPTTKEKHYRLQPSKYTMPEWQLFPPADPPVERDLSTDGLLRRPTTSNLTYGAFNQDQMRTARAIPTRTRADEASQINQTEKCEAYMAEWAPKMMNTTYRHDICHSNYKQTVQQQDLDQTVLVYSKNTLTPEASEKAKAYVDKDPVWTRNFRELCRSLNDAIDATAYRAGFTTLKTAPGERFTHPKWSDPPYVSHGLKKPAEAYWMPTYHTDFVDPGRLPDSYTKDDQHRARYSNPFDFHPKTEKQTTTFRAEFVDHMASKDDHPEYWTDMVVRIPPGTAVVGNCQGHGPRP
jgi:hypothetical protein